MNSIKEFKKAAFQLFSEENLSLGQNDPIDFLYSLNWDISTGPAFTEDLVAQMNLNLDEMGCFGRTVRAAVLTEQCFPKEKFFFGEIYEDFFRGIILANTTQERWNDDTFIAEVLQYENPHSVLIWQDTQFDPLFKMFDYNPRGLKHPLVLQHSPWEALFAVYLVSQATMYLYEGRPEAMLNILNRAESICPLILVKENKIAAYGTLGDYDEAIRLAKEVAEVKKDAKILWYLHTMTGDQIYKDEIVCHYDIQMFHYLTKSLP